MSRWPYQRLGDICSTTSGGTPSRSHPEYFGGGIPWIKSGDLTDGDVTDFEETITEEAIRHSSAKMFQQGTVLIAMYGATVGKLGMLGIDAATNQAVCGISTPDELDRWFLFYFLLSQRQKLIKQSAGGAQPNISQKIVRELLIPVPPLTEQRLIVDLLSRAEGIVRLRRDAERKSAELIPALFLDMFGDPATNPKGWPLRKVSAFVSRFEGGKNLQAGSEDGSPYRILKVSAATSGIYRESESKPSPDGYNPPPSHIVRAGDILFSRANTEELVGATAIVESTNGKTLLPDKLWRIVWAEPAESLYMHALFQSPHVRRELGKLSSGTSASMRNISQGKLFGLALPVAPHEWQKRFAEQAKSARSIVAQQVAATSKAQATFDSLLTQVFSD